MCVFISAAMIESHCVRMKKVFKWLNKFVFEKS